MEGPPQIPTGADYQRAMRIRLMPLVRVCADAHSYAVDGVVRFTFVWRGSEGEITVQIRRWWGQLGGHEDLAFAAALEVAMFLNRERGGDGGEVGDLRGGVSDDRG